MKTEAISRRELPRLIRCIREHGTFAGTRGGHPVKIERDPAPLVSAPPIRYAIKTGAAWVHDRAASVYAAVDAINHIAKGARA